jgi:hypothetical protein
MTMSPSKIRASIDHSREAEQVTTNEDDAQ